MRQRRDERTQALAERWCWDVARRAGWSRTPLVEGVSRLAVGALWDDCFDDDRRLMEHGCLKDAKPPWHLGQPPQQHERVVRGPVVVTRLMGALATASRRPRARADSGGEPVGWPRWRRPRVEESRDQVIGWAHGDNGLLHRAESSLL